MIQIPHTKPDTYIHCPACGKGDYAVDHLAPRCCTSWYCDLCGVRYRLVVQPDKSIDCKVLDERIVKTIVTLRCDAPFTMTVEGMQSVPTDEDFLEQQRYFYEEHSCPTNSFGELIEIFDAEGQSDPHGLLKFVKVEIPNESR